MSQYILKVSDKEIKSVIIKLCGWTSNCYITLALQFINFRLKQIKYKETESIGNNWLKKPEG